MSDVTRPAIMVGGEPTENRPEVVSNRRTGCSVSTQSDGGAPFRSPVNHDRNFRFHDMATDGARAKYGFSPCFTFSQFRFILLVLNAI